jgi:hypothetical protein
VKQLKFWGWRLFDHFTWDHAATLLAATIGAGIAVAVAVLTYLSSQRTARRERQAAVYAEALRSVEDYLEGPYRIRRRGKGEGPEITRWISDVKSRNNYYQGLLRLHGPVEVADAFDAFVAAAIREAGPQMTDAWHQPRRRRDRDMPLGEAYPRTDADEAKKIVIAKMAKSLG